jgi:hypothetical protein
MDVPGVDGVSPAQDAVELFENLLGVADLDRRADQANLITASARVDAELLFEDAEGPITVAVESGSCVVVVEDQRLTGGGGVSGQWFP